MDHDHTISFDFTTGAGWLRIVVVSGVLFVAAFTLVRPAIPPPGRSARLAVTVTAGCAGLLLLLLSGGMDIPQQAIVAMLALAAMAVAVARHRESPAPTAVAAFATRAAPALVVVAAVAAAFELAAAVLDPGGSARHGDTGLLVGLVGLAWLVLCRPARRLTALATHALGWTLGNLVLAGVTGLAAAGIPG